MPTLAATLAEHLRAIRARDLDALAATIDPDDVVLVGGDGALCFGRDAFLARHRDWFASWTWTLDADVLHVRETPPLATVLLRLRYRDARADAAPIDEASLLSLVFRQNDGEWRMVQDQNTPIRTS